jgi:hypothetical protein
MEDFMQHENHNVTLSTNLLLENLQKRLKLENQSLEKYGFPTPAKNNTELEEELLHHCPIQNKRLLDTLLHTEPNNFLQNVYFRRLMPSVKEFQDAKDSQTYIQKRFIFLDGLGGVEEMACIL